MANRTCFELPQAVFQIKLTQQGRNKFTVTYGKQVKKGLCYDAAATELGAAIMHAAALDQKLDNRLPGEA